VEREIEDIEALIDEVGSPVYLYGFSSGAVLALEAAVQLGDKVASLALHEPPLDSGDDQAKQYFAEFKKQMAELSQPTGAAGGVYFFAGMLPPEMI
jgi:pimeloyl-ACP methyl ester carboxylesterase